ncbi:MAG: hypothetical protein WC764_00810 [Candidatus Paceibacterota bacterium]|jgi:hypothetical protein
MTDVKSILNNIRGIFSIIVPLCVGLALIYFIYGLAEYILVSGEASKKEEGRMRMVWGTIAMFVIISVWGLVNLLQATVWGNTQSSSLNAPPAPQFNK